MVLAAAAAPPDAGLIESNTTFLSAIHAMQLLELQQISFAIILCPPEQEIQERLPPERKIKNAMIDKSPTEMRALEDCGMRYFLCLFHVLQAWERFVRSADGGVTSKDVRKAILADIIALAKCADAAAFQIIENGMKTK